MWKSVRKFMQISYPTKEAIMNRMNCDEESDFSSEIVASRKNILEEKKKEAKQDICVDECFTKYYTRKKH